MPRHLVAARPRAPSSSTWTQTTSGGGSSATALQARLLRSRATMTAPAPPVAHLPHLRAHWGGRVEQKRYSVGRVARYWTGGLELRRREEVGGKSAPHPASREPPPLPANGLATPATCYQRAASASVLGGWTLRAGPLKDVRRMEWRRWCAVVRRQWWEHGGATWRPRGLQLHQSC
jgi:hypothetical protein